MSVMNVQYMAVKEKHDVVTLALPGALPFTWAWPIPAVALFLSVSALMFGRTGNIPCQMAWIPLDCFPESHHSSGRDMTEGHWYMK